MGVLRGAQSSRPKLSLSSLLFAERFPKSDDMPVMLRY